MPDKDDLKIKAPEVFDDGAPNMELFDRAKALIYSSRNSIGVYVNSVTIYACFLIGKYIFEEEQLCRVRARYAAQVIDSLSNALTAEFGRGFSRSSLMSMRKFFLTYKERDRLIVQSPIGQLCTMHKNGVSQSRAFQQQINIAEFPFKLSWTHYLLLIRIDDNYERMFYENEAIDGVWSVATLNRQIRSSLYERIALSRNRSNVLSIVKNGTRPYRPEEILKSPFVLEFTGFGERCDYQESDLETAILNRMQDFLLEMGKGFLFEKRQRRFTFNEKDFYLDLVLYNRYLRCYVLIDFKVDALTHQDLGQMQMYVNYYDRYELGEGENPTVGILMCKQSDQALVELTLPKDSHIFASEYRSFFPDKKILKNKLKEWIDESESLVSNGSGKFLPSSCIEEEGKHNLKNRVINNQKTLNSNALDILNLIADDPYISRLAICKRLGLSAGEVRYCIETLKANGLIRRVGPKKGGQWSIEKKKLSSI